MMEEENTNNSARIIIYSVLAVLALIVLYTLIGFNFLNIQIPELGDNASLMLLFMAGILTGFHCIAMCGGFVVSYTAKNAINGHKSFTQHLVYGGSKVLSYTIIGGIFGLIGGLVSFSIGLRGWVAILAGVFMIFYSLSMFGFKFFRKFQFNPKFLTRVASQTSKSVNGQYLAPLITGLLNGLFIACGPLQAMYLFAAGTGSFLHGALSLAAFGIGTLPVMLIFGSLATAISHKTTAKILKLSAIIVLILGLVMLNRGLTLAGSSYSFDSMKANIIGTNANGALSVINNNVQEINMQVSSSGYSPNSFVLKSGIPVKWNVNVIQLTSCNQELVSSTYNININLKQGLNIIEFTPNKAGTFSFSCGMGMLKGSFIVTESGTATQTQINQATPKTSETCSMGSRGSCGCGMMG
jgi:sulfite exporter TauE/SafE